MKTVDKSRRFAFHHQNETLLFQFLLHECICAQHILRDNPSREMLRYMIGNVDREENIWQPQYGHVPRLRYYCTLFTTHFGDPSSPLTEQLDQTVERAYHAALKCRSLREKDEASLTVLYQSLSAELSCLLKLLFEKLPDYRDCPAILHFLLRHQEKCDAAYQESIVKKMFSSFFPQGSEQAQTFLIDWFSKKGFEHLLPSIEEHLRKIGSLYQDILLEGNT